MSVQEEVHRSTRAFQTWRKSKPSQRAQVLRSIALTLEAEAEGLLTLAEQETHLGSPRLPGELSRTCFQLRLFAQALIDGDVLADQTDEEVSGTPPEGHPKMVRVQRPIGVVAVFGASNFPFAFGVVGGDTVSALAAGCTVIVKEHPAHPKLSRMLVEVARGAISATGVAPDILTSVRGFTEGQDLVAVEAVKAVGFTGSVAGGRHLFDIAAGRPEPIPFFGEMGSVNPVVVTRAADASRSEMIAREFVDSMTLGAGQFCTKPALLFVPWNSSIPQYAAAVISELAALPLLTEEIGTRFEDYVSRAANLGSILAGGKTEEGRAGTVRPTLIEASAEQVLDPHNRLNEECFGPSAVVVRYFNDEEAEKLCRSGAGVLVSCIQGEVDDAQVTQLIDILEQRSGRVVWNGWPTGVAVTRHQMHGGPYPASTAPLNTSVGLEAIRRFLRPVVFQGFDATPE